MEESVSVMGLLTGISFMCVCVCECTFAMVCVRKTKDNIVKLILNYVDPGD